MLFLYLRIYSASEDPILSHRIDYSNTRPKQLHKSMRSNYSYSLSWSTSLASNCAHPWEPMMCDKSIHFQLLFQKAILVL